MTTTLVAGYVNTSASVIPHIARLTVRGRRPRQLGGQTHEVAPAHATVRGKPVTVDIQPVPTQLVTAFLGAEGFGAYADGWRGSSIYHVTNTHNGGTGSLRDAVAVSNRIIVFDTGGTCTLTSDIDSDANNLYIAGQSVPLDSGGFTVTGKFVELGGNDVVVRFLRCRPNFNPGGGGQTKALNMRGNGWIVDHCTVGWSYNDSFTAGGQWNNGTVQWCLAHEGFAPGDSRAYNFQSQVPGTRVSFHHNASIMADIRHPQFANVPGLNNDLFLIDGVGNVRHDHDGRGKVGDDDSPNQDVRMNWVNNWTQNGPNTTGDFQTSPWNANRGDNTTIYLSGNVRDGAASGQDEFTGSPTFTGTKHAIEAKFAITTQTTAEREKQLVLGHAGASHPYRDLVDTRHINAVLNDTGTRYGSVAATPEGIETLASGTARAWSGNMPTTWDNALGNVDGASNSGNGATWVEMPLNRWGDTTHEPNGYTPIFEHCFNGSLLAEGASSTANANGLIDGGWKIYDKDGLSVVSDTSAPISHTGILRSAFPIGLQGGGGSVGGAKQWNLQGWDGSGIDWSDSPQQYAKIYVCAWVKIGNLAGDAQPGFGMPPAQQKFLQGAVGQGEKSSKVDWRIMLPNLVNQNQNDRQIEFRCEINVQNVVKEVQVGAANSRQPNINATHRFNSGQWVKIETVMEQNSSTSANGGDGSQDGIWRVWVNDLQVHEHTNWVFRNDNGIVIEGVRYPSPNGFWVWKWEPTWGGGGAGTKPVPDHMDMDHIYISGVI